VPVVDLVDGKAMIATHYDGTHLKTGADNNSVGFLVNHYG
jgi:hypothetical protein